MKNIRKAKISLEINFMVQFHIIKINKFCARWILILSINSLSAGEFAPLLTCHLCQAEKILQVLT